MKFRKTVALVFAVMMLSAALSGCADAPSGEPADKPDEPAAENTGIMAVDMIGRTVALDKPAEKVVVLSAAECEIIYALGAGEMLVGRGAYCNYPEEVMNVPEVNSGSETNVEQIIALDPDLVIMSMMDQTEEQVAALESAGIAVALSKERDIESVYQSIGVIGELLGREKEADALVADMKSDFDELSKKAAEKDGGTVYFEVSPLEYGLWTTGTNTFMNEISVMLGLENIFADVSGWAAISEEQVLSRNPDYIVTITMYYGEGPTPVEEIMGRAGWQNVTAVKNGDVFNANSDEIARPGPRLVDAAEMLYEYVYGE